MKPPGPRQPLRGTRYPGYSKRALDPEPPKGAVDTPKRPPKKNTRTANLKGIKR